MNPNYSTGLELILNACEGTLQIAITDNEQPLCFEQWHEPNKATEILVPALQQICERLEIAPNAFRRIGCFNGPGSFTGIRLALVTAAALRRAGNAQLASLNYLQALATSAVQRRGLLYGASVFAITHARRQLVHLQEFISFGPVIPAQPKSEITLVTPETAMKSLVGKTCMACGSALRRYPEIFTPAPYDASSPNCGPTLLPELIHPDLSSLCLLARHGDYFPKDLEPKYVRGCDAIENLISTKGNDSAEIKELNRLLSSHPPVNK